MVPQVSADDLRDAWPLLDAEERLAGFEGLERAEAPDFFQSLSSRSQAQIRAGRRRRL